MFVFSGPTFTTGFFHVFGEVFHVFGELFWFWMKQQGVHGVSKDLLMGAECEAK